MKWTTSTLIKENLLKKWNNKKILIDYYNNQLVFPLTININYPKSNEVLKNFSLIRDWINQLEKNKQHYQIQYSEINYRSIGTNMIPTKIIINNFNDLLKIIDKQQEFNLINSNYQLLLIKYPKLKEWLIKNILTLTKTNKYYNNIIMIIDYFIFNDVVDYYIRQLCINGIDTKFIEKNKPILRELLDIMLNESKINRDHNNFECRYYLKSKPIFVRMRLLDNNSPYTDVQITLDEFINSNFCFDNVFLIENEINYLSFPNFKNSLAIFTKGYGIEVFKDIDWMKNQKLYYWGDIDTHGYQILSIARKYYPDIESMFMDEDTLLKYSDLWVTEEKPYNGEFLRLNEKENIVANRLQNNFYGNNIRFEQERIPYNIVLNYLDNKLNIN